MGIDFCFEGTFLGGLGGGLGEFFSLGGKGGGVCDLYNDASLNNDGGSAIVDTIDNLLLFGILGSFLFVFGTGLGGNFLFDFCFIGLCGNFFFDLLTPVYIVYESFTFSSPFSLIYLIGLKLDFGEGNSIVSSCSFGSCVDLGTVSYKGTLELFGIDDLGTYVADFDGTL